MQLVISAASRSSDVQILRRILEDGLPSLVRALLVTPLMVTPYTLRLSRALQEDLGLGVMFDSGGYAVQTGRLDYFEMYSRLLELYRRERWAALYTLPDHVPTSQDSDETVEAKVRQTVECSELFYRELPDELCERALGVAHGRSLAQIEFCLDHYLRLGLRHVGFGSFGTAGENSSMNIVTERALDNARRLAGLAQERGMTTHLFGIGAPALLPWAAWTGATSFDSANWARSAGFGQVFLPLTRGYNISHRNGTAKLEKALTQTDLAGRSALSARQRRTEIQKGLTQDDFERLREISNHACRFCDSFELLQTSRVARAGHNLLATADALTIIERGDLRQMDAIYEAASPRYRARWRRLMQHV